MHSYLYRVGISMAQNDEGLTFLSLPHGEREAPVLYATLAASEFPRIPCIDSSKGWLTDPLSAPSKPSPNRVT